VDWIKPITFLPFTQIAGQTINQTDLFAFHKFNKGYQQVQQIKNHQIGEELKESSSSFFLKSCSAKVGWDFLSLLTD
jgi:hypothetical protein